MRKLSFCVLIAIAGNVSAQAPPPGSPEAVLRAWELAMKDVRSYAVVVKRTTKDNVLKATDIHQGYVAMRKVGEKNLTIHACLELKKTTDKNSFEKYVVRDDELFEYAPANNIVRVHKFPKNQGGEPSFLAFIVGMSADQAKARYGLAPSKEVPVDGYHYIDIEPKNEKDKRDFSTARLVFDRRTNMLVQVAYQKAHQVIIWEFDKAQRDVQIPDSYLDPALPMGWRLDRVKMP